MASPILQPNGRFLRDQVAEFVRVKVGQGVYRPGDRVPSVRAMSKLLGIAPSTVVDAYRSLETEGLILARPQSGFYVPLARWREAGLSKTRPAAPPSLQNEFPLFMRVLRDSKRDDVVSLAVADPSNEQLPAATMHRLLARVLRENPEYAIGYDVSIGHRPLREQIARRAIAMGCGLSPEEIVVTNGCSEALALSLRAVCEPGQIVAVESPAYYGVLFAIHSLGLRALEIGSDPVTGLCLEELDEALRTYDVRAVLTNSTFSNPMGSTIPAENKRLLVETLAARGVPLIEDDVYGDLGHDGERPVVAKAFDRGGQVLLCSSFSKTIAPGYRIGWVAGGGYHERIAELKFGFSVCAASAPQAAVAEFLETERYVRTVQRAARTYGANLGSMREYVLERFPVGTRCSHPLGGFVLWVELPNGLDSVDLYERCRAHGVTFMPGPAFATHGGYRNFLRLNASAWNRRVARAIEVIGAEARK